MNYHYVAFDQQGQRLEGKIDVPDEQAAEEFLWRQGLTVARLSPMRRRITLYEWFPTFLGVKKRELIIFSRQLATLIGSGIDMLRALQLLAEQAPGRALQHVLPEVIADLQQGQTLSAAMASHPYAFSDLYVATIRIGESTGNLEDILNQLADYLEKEVALARKIRDALTYPFFVLSVAVLVVVLMLTVALPPMVDLFQSFGAALPRPTRALIAISRFATQYGPYLLFAWLVATAVCFWWFSQPSGRRVRDNLLLRIPFLGPIVLQGHLARFAHTASALVDAGLPLIEVMELVNTTLGNVVVAEALGRARTALLSGQGLSTPLANEPLFPPLLSQMVRVGEETGTLERNLKTLADLYEMEVDRKIKQMAAMVEPALTIFIGLVVAFIAVSLVMPMYSILTGIE